MNLTRFSQTALVTALTGITVISSTVSPTHAQTTRRVSQVPAGNICRAQLSSRIDRVISRVPGRWSVLVQNQAPQGQRQNLYAQNASMMLVPASNNKIFTTAAALKKLGAQFQLRTVVFGNVADANLGTLRVIGQGDPSLSSSHLVALMRQLQQKGIRRVNLLIGDDTAFRGEPFNPYWATRHRGEGYAPPVNSLLLNENNIYTGAVPNPGNYFVREFRRILTKAGIQIDNSTLVKRTPAPNGEVELASVVSPPLSSLLIETNRESNNVYAEALLKTLGRLQEPASLDSTTSGVNAVRSILSDMGVNPNRYTMVDGSGLAERNRASAEALVQTLQAMALQPEAQIFRRSLAVAGQNGTLKSRFVNTSARGIVAAKTGTIDGAVSLAGYLDSPNYAPLVFGFVVNSSRSPSTIRAAIDQVVVLLTQLRDC